jgi:hypothetical protein
VEPNEIDILAFAVLCNLEQINDAQETRIARQGWRDIRKTDRLDRIHFDLAFFHSVAVAHYDVRAHPYSDTASDFSSTNSIAKSLGKRHEVSLHSAMVGGGHPHRYPAGRVHWDRCQPFFGRGHTGSSFTRRTEMSLVMCM